MNTTKAPTIFMIIAIIAVLWNAMGLVMFLTDVVFMTPEMLASMTAEQQAVYVDNPMWMKIIYGVATVFGLLGAIGLLLKKQWAIICFVISLIAVIVQMGYSMYNAGAVSAMPVFVILIAAFLVYYSRKSKLMNWIA